MTVDAAFTRMSRGSRRDRKIRNPVAIMAGVGVLNFLLTRAKKGGISLSWLSERG